MEKQINIAVVDDHHLFRSGIINLVEKLSSKFKVVIEANNGKDFLDKLTLDPLPDIVLLDISMPIMDGYKTAEILGKKYPKLKILVLSMNDDEVSLIRMLKLGVKGFVSKDVDPKELKNAILSVIEKGYYHTELMTTQLVSSYQNFEKNEVEKLLTENELTFLKLSCSEDTYAEIANRMCLSPRTIHGYRDAVFSKLNLNTRLGLIIFAIKIKLVVLS